MKEYPKIQSLFKRDEKGKFTGDFSFDEFAYLFANEWIGTEKIDGTSMRISYNQQSSPTKPDDLDDKFSVFEYRGRTDKAQIPPMLQEKLDEYIQKWNYENAFAKTFNTLEDGIEVVLYGEGYGHKIQKGSRYKSDGVDFILFDVKIGNWWLKREDVVAIGETLGLKVVPEVFRGSLSEAMDFVKNGFKSRIAEDETLDAEGLVLTPTIPLFSRNGGRIITKLKTKDFVG